VGLQSTAAEAAEAAEAARLPEAESVLHREAAGSSGISGMLLARGRGTSLDATMAAAVAEAAGAIALLVLGTRVRHQLWSDDGSCCGGGCRSNAAKSCW
jgi:hypothetical protein